MTTHTTEPDTDTMTGHADRPLATGLAGPDTDTAAATTTDNGHQMTGHPDIDPATEQGMATDDDRGHPATVTGHPADTGPDGQPSGQADIPAIAGSQSDDDQTMATPQAGHSTLSADTMAAEADTATDKNVAAAETAAAATVNQRKSTLTKGSDPYPTPDEGDRRKTTGAGVSHRINPDDARFIRLIVAGFIIAGLVAFAISFVALMEVAAWLGLPVWMHWGIPAFIDVAILVNAGAVLVHKSRGESAWKAWLALFTFTALSVVANTAHALSHDQETEWQSIIAAVIAGMVPMAIFAATEQLAAVAVEDPEARRQELEAQETWAAQQAEREQRRLEMEHQREIARQKAELDREEHLTEIELRRAQREELLARARTNQSPTATSAGASPSPPASSSPKSSGSSTQLDEVAAWITQRSQAGEDTTGKDLEDHFGVSQRTGRRYLKKLRDTQPEIFLTDEGDHR